MKIRMPSRKVCRDFRLTYELKGAQRGADILTRYYGIRRMRIILDGRRVGNGNEAIHWEGKAFFTKRGLNKRNVLHELYHHIVEKKRVKMIRTIEEREACRFAREVMKKK